MPTREEKVALLQRADKIAQLQAYDEQQQQPVAEPAGPRDTTFGEKAAGLALDLGVGTMRATKTLPDLASFILPDAATDPISEFFERGIDSAEAIKPEAYKAKQAESFIARDEAGDFEGFQLPSFEHIAGITAASLPMIPHFLVGGGAVATPLKALPWLKAHPAMAQALGYGVTNAALVAPDQWRQTYKEALDAGQSEEEARDSADASALITAAVSGVTGAAGGAVASKLGAESSNVASAVAKGFVGEAPFEGIEEAGQSIAGDIGIGRPIDPINALDAGLSGTAAGTQGSGVAAIQHLANRNQPPATEPEPEKTLESIIQEAIDGPVANEPMPELPPPEATAEQTPEVITPEVVKQVEPQPQIDTEPAPDVAPTVTQPTPTPVEARTEAEIAENVRKVEELAAGDEDQQKLEAAIDEKYKDVKRPPELLQYLARNDIRLDRTKFGGDLVDDSNLQMGMEWLFEGVNSGYEGMGPDGLREFLRDNGWVNESELVTDHDAVDILNRALAGERIIHPDDLDAELDYEEALRWEAEKAAEKDAGVTEEQDDALWGKAGEIGESLDENITDEEFESEVEAAFNKQSTDEGANAWLEESDVDEETSQDSDEAGTGSEKEGLVPEATTDEKLQSAEKQKTAERNRLGEDEVTPDQGEGELFAGNEPGTRPAQNTLFTDEAATEARAYLDSQLGTAFSNPIDPKAYKALVTIAGNKIEHGVRTFDAFSRSMIKEFGDRIKPHLKKLWKDAGGKDQETPDQPQAQARPEPSSGPTTSTKNAVTDAERAARDEDPVMKEARQSNPDLIEKAEQAMANNPDLADEIIDRLNNDPEPSISVLMEAILFIKKVDVRREMRRLAAKAADGNETSQKQYAELLLRQLEIDAATHASGAVWGRLGQLRSRMMNEDYSFEAQAEAFAARQGEPLSDEQSDFIKAQAKQIEDLTSRLEEANKQAQEARDKFFTEESFDQLKKQVQQQKRTKVSREKQLDRRIAEERKWLRENMGRAGAGIPADQLVHLSKLGGLLITKGATTFAKWTKAMKQALGDKLFRKIEGSLKELFDMSLEEDTRNKAEFAQESVEELTVEAEALGEIGEELTHKLVYDLARALVRSGMRSENAVMAEVHSILSEHFEGLSERDVRRLFSEYGQATFPSQAADLKRMRELRVLVRLQESIDRLQEGLAAKRTGLQRDKDTQEIRDKNRTLSILKRRYDRENPMPSRDKLASIDQTRITRLENQIADLEKQIKTGEKPVKGEPVPDSAEVTKLKAKRDALKAHLQAIEDAKKVQLTPDEKYNVLRGKQLRRDLAETAQRIRDKDYAKRTRKEPPPLSEANKQLRSQLVNAKMKLHEQQADWLRSKLKPHQKVGDFISQSINLSRAMMTSIDLSAVLRQGGFKMMANPRTAIKAFVPMMKALQNDANANAVNDEILSRPNADLYQKAKLHLSEQDSAHPTKMEEVYMGRWQKKVPGVAASGRAYVTFLNKLRADSFDAGMKYFGRKGEVLTIEEMRELASYINNATGRFDLTKTGKVAGQGLSNIFFAPRWMLSRFAMIVGQPMWNASPRMRKYIALEYTRFMLGFSTLFGLAALGFAGNSDDDDEEFWQLDPRSTDFGKIKVGNTRLDMMAGLSQPIVFLSRIISGGKLSSKGKVVPIRDSWRFGVPEGAEVGFAGDDGKDIAFRFVRSKFAPPISAGFNLISGKNVIGETYEERGVFLREVLGLPAGIAENPAIVEALGMATPLSMRDFYDALIEHGLPKAAAFQVLATLGVSMNTYDTSGGKKEGRPKRPSRSKRPKRPTRD